jgi:hypothetical protein
MKESEIRAKAVATLEADNWLCWWPPKPRFSYKDTDIFGVFDIVAVQRGTHAMKWVQLTTHNGGNMAARRRKILDSFKRYDYVIKNAEVWGVAPQ